MKKMFALLLSALLLLSLSFTGCSNDDPFANIPETPVEEFEVVAETDYVWIKRYIGNSETVKIPSEIEGKPVTLIGVGAFVNMNVKTIILLDSVDMIHDVAFMNCKQLSEVSFGKNLKIINHEAFRNCVSLKRIVLPESLTDIKNYAFADCTGLTEIQINGTDLSIGKGAFELNRSLTDLTLNGVKSFGDGAFAGASQLESVIIPETVETINDGAFTHCPKLTDVFFRGNLPETINESTFTSQQTITLHYKKDAAGIDNPALDDYILKEYE